MSRATKDSRFSHRFETLQQLSRDVLAHARKQGATACDVDVSEGFGQSVTVRHGAVSYTHLTLPTSDLV